MKNIHVIATNEPSNGYILGKCIKELSDVKIGQFTKTYYLMFNEEYFQPQNIYITSDEEIKEGDWYLTNKNTLCKCIKADSKYVYSLEGGSSTNCKKIILTTDQDLIKDGVQAIKDEFLEWFVKNPSCEEVDVKNPLIANVSDFGYKIIIPKEEPRMLTVEDFNKAKISYKEPKEEFLKQERMSGSKTVNKILDGGKPNRFLVDEIGQFNFQKFKLYNEEEVGELVYKIIGEYGNHYGLMIDGEMINELFEKFKKK